MEKYTLERMRRIEVDKFNNLGFEIDGDNLTETNHGWKNESREASSYEKNYWERMESSTPKFQHITLSSEECSADSFWDWDYKSYLNSSDIKDEAVWLLTSSILKRAAFFKKEDNEWEMLESSLFV